MMQRGGVHQNKSEMVQKYYKGKGITVFEPWHDFKTFAEWAMSSGYADDLTIDRIDSSKGYYPDNCRWLTKGENSRNRDHHKLNHEKAAVIRAAKGSKSVYELALEYGVRIDQIYKVWNGRAWACAT